MREIIQSTKKRKDWENKGEENKENRFIQPKTTESNVDFLIHVWLDTFVPLNRK